MTRKDTTVTATATAETPAPARGRSRRRRRDPELTSRPAALARTWTRAVLVRAGIGLSDAVLALVTVFWAIPQTGGWIRSQVAPNLAGTSIEGLIAFWVVPFVFAVALIGIAEVALMRWLWRAGTASMVRYRAARGLGREDPAAARTGTTTRSGGSARTGKSRKKRN